MSRKPIFPNADRTAFILPVAMAPQKEQPVDVPAPQQPAATRPAPHFYKLSELSDLLRIHQNTLLMEIRRRRLGATKVAGVWRVSQQALDNYLSSQTVKTAAR